MGKDKVYQCEKCGAVQDKKKLCKPEHVKKENVKEKDLHKKPCGKKS